MYLLRNKSKTFEEHCNTTLRLESAQRTKRNKKRLKTKERNHLLREVGSFHLLPEEEGLCREEAKVEWLGKVDEVQVMLLVVKWREYEGVMVSGRLVT